MIIGLGTDLVEIARITDMSEKIGAQFLRRVLTPLEHERGPKRKQALLTYTAGRFAAKEAAVKALGTGFAEGITMQDVEILALASGKPELFLHNKARDRAEALGVRSAHVSISHERNTALATVILEG